MKELVLEAKKASGEEASADPSKLKDTLLEVIHGALFTSGVLEKYVTRAVNQRLETDIKEIIQREIQTTLSGENVKILIDDKFRAISLYLKTEVIPKAVAQILKGSKQLA
jgi:hypothetical protein